VEGTTCGCPRERSGLGNAVCPTLKTHERGIEVQSVRRLFLAVVVLPVCMLYAADIFLTPQTCNRTNATAQKSGQAIIKKLSAVQQRATISLTGGMNTTANNTLDILSNLLPFHLLVEIPVVK